jgi:hypoxanthine phosphoribosyltransferase
MHTNIEVLISEEDIREKVKALGIKITEEYKNEEIIVIGLLKGTFIFMADLIREIKLPLKIDFMTVSSYGNEKISSREVKIVQDLSENIMGKHILIVEDIIDSGLTLNKVIEILKTREPKSLKLVAFLNKPSKREVYVKLDYTGYDISDEFVVGYGLDFSQYYRNLPYIGIIKGE